MVLEGPLVRLEPVALSHVPELVAAASESQETYGFADVPDGPDAMRAYVQAALEAPGVVPFAIVSQGRVVGSTRFLRIEHWRRLPDRPPGIPHVADIGWTWLAASAQRTGVSTEAKYLTRRAAGGGQWAQPPSSSSKSGQAAMSTLWFSGDASVHQSGACEPSARRPPASSAAATLASA